MKSKRKFFRRLLSVVLSAVMLVSIMAVAPVTVGAYSIPSESEFAQKISNLQSTFKDGEYWNKYNANDYSHTGSTICPTAACRNQGYCYYCACTCGAYVEGSTEKAWQCDGFAKKMAYECFGVYISSSSWGVDYSLGTVYAGDIIRINNDGHSIFVYKVVGSTIYYADCNRTGPCRVSWGNTISYSSLSSKFTYKRHLSGNTLTGGGSTSYDPYGTIDSVSDTGSGSISVRGWAYDADNLSQALEIHVYIGGQAGSGAPCYSITANTSRTDVNNVYGCGDSHGFDATITTDRRGTQEVYIYAINIGGGSNVLLGHKSVSITAETTPPTISDVTISQMTGSGFRVSCKVSDASGISKVQFPTWTDNNGQDDLIWHDGTISNGTATAYIKTSDHNGEGGTYIVHIYAYDTCGNSASTATATVITDTPTEVASTTYNGNTYKVFNSGYNWQQAKEWCEENGGHLAAITSSAEWSAVKKALETFNGEECWLGAENTSGSWAWVTGESFSYSNWASGQPDNGGGTEHYLGTINSSGSGHLYCYSWNDYNVSSEYVGGFVCEYESVKSLTLSSTSVSMLAGDTEQLTATVTPSSYSGSVTWTSSNTNVTKVDSSGKITAVGVGTAKITASVDGKTATCAVTVDPAEVYFESNEVTLMVGDGISQDLLYDSDEDTGISYSSKPTWKSSDTDVATVDEWGNVVAVSTGTAVITATAKSGVSASFTVNVVEESDVYIDYYTDFVLSGYNELYLMDYETGNVYEGDVTWKSSNESVATVEKIEDAQGYANVTALSAGTVTITATTDDGKSVSRTVSIIDDIHGGIANVTVTKLPTKEFTEAIEKDWITTDDYGLPYIDYTSTGEDFSTAAKEREIAQNMAGAEILITFKDGTTQSYTFTDESDGPFSYSYTYGYPSIVMDNGYKLEVEVKDLGDYEAEITCMRGTCYCTTTFSVKNAIDDTQGDDDVDTDTDDVLKGDVNDDGSVDMRDCVRLAKYICEWDVTVNERVIDTNGDGILSMTDAVRLAKYICGWKVEIYKDTLKK